MPVKSSLYHNFNFRIWSLSSNKTAISAHLVLRPNADIAEAEKVLQAATLSIR